jgi:Mrp family chromosome partitioning ATPase
MPAGGRLGEFVQYSELKQLAFNIAMLQQEKMFHSLAVLSFFPGEGKTLFCAAAAMAYADVRQSRVLIIDTTTLQNQGSLLLRDCFTPPSPAVDLMTMQEIRAGSNDAPMPESGRARDKHQILHEPEIATNTRLRTVSGQGSDPNLLRMATQEKSKSHGLVLMDTAPLNSRNKSNVDPLVVARQSDASVLIVSRALLDAADLSACLKIARDPTLRLIGVVANEKFPS